MGTEQTVVGHYSFPQLQQTIVEAITRAGKNPSQITYLDLAPVDEFHAGGIDATRDLAGQMDLHKGQRLLDVGCGIGGPARLFAAEYGCQVTGVDLTPEFVHAAKALTQMVKLDSQTAFKEGSALALPFEKNEFDRASMIHVGMNIPDKAGVFREVRRVLRSGSLFGIFDLMLVNDGVLDFPMPWAATGDDSFVTHADSYRADLQAAGFKMERERSRRAFVLEYTEQVVSRMAQGGPPALGLHLLMRERTPQMLKNVVVALKKGALDPIEMVARAV
jgi:ubiquinone/menaquinone biosynthesis C-methylase UbiE